MNIKNLVYIFSEKLFCPGDELLFRVALYKKKIFPKTTKLVSNYKTLDVFGKLVIAVVLLSSKDMNQDIYTKHTILPLY